MLRLAFAVSVTLLLIVAPSSALAARCGDEAYCKEACASAYPWPFKTHKDRQACRIRCHRCGNVAHHESGSLHVYTMGPRAKIKFDTIVGAASSRQCVRVTTFGADGRPDGLNSGRIYSNGLGLGANGEKQVRGSACYELKPLVGVATVKYASNGSAWSVVMYSSSTEAVEVVHIGMEDGMVRFSVPSEYMSAKGALLEFLKHNYQAILNKVAR